MSHRRIVLAFATLVLVIACSSSAPEPIPSPEPTGPTAEELRQQEIADSIARAQAEAEAQRRAEMERKARELELRAEASRGTLRETVYFDYDEASLLPETETRLRAKLEILRAHPGVQLRMEGHADERGTSEYNIALGNERAGTVIRFLTGFGLDAGRFSAVSYGEERPVAQGSTERAWAENRRVEFVITAGAGEIGS